MSKINLKILSQQLNVSVSTVSKALNDSHEISNDTKKRILEAAKKLGYTPNPYAGFLRSHKSKTIALVIPELTNNFFIQVISGAEAVAHQKDFHVLIYTTHDDCKQEERILKDLQNGRVDGVIMSLSGTTTSYDHVNELILSNIPVVLFDRICSDVKTTKIITDDFDCGFNATCHLIESGCSDIAYLSIFENLSIISKRLQGYIEALKQHNIPFNSNRVVKCESNEVQNKVIIQQLLNSENRPDGLFASVEMLAITSYMVCNELTIKIPDSIKIISFSNIATAPLLNPSLTTISQPAFEMGEKAASVLFEQLEKKRFIIPEQEIVMKSLLLKRNSTKKPA